MLYLGLVLKAERAERTLQVGSFSEVVATNNECACAGEQI